MKDAPIVLLDEATASLDVENETKVQNALTRLLAGKTVLVIAHRMRTVENVDKIVVINEGKVAEQGKPQELYEKKDSIYRHMHDLQTFNADWSI
jgi:ATP-binding cassette subfamily B protein